MFFYKNTSLHWNGIELARVCHQAEQLLQKEYNYEGAFYLYSMDVFQQRIQILKKHLPNIDFYYAVKSLSNGVFLKELKKHSSFGLDIVSAGELYRAQVVSFPSSKVVFAGVGKTRQEMKMALRSGIHAFHVESMAELKTLAQVAAQEAIPAAVGLRLNPNISVQTHDYIKTGTEDTKFGIHLKEYPEALSFCQKNPNLRLVGLQVHLGSQLFSAQVYGQALKTLDAFFEQAQSQGLTPHYLSLGGGFGVDYELAPQKTQADEFSLQELYKELQPYLNRPYRIALEPGRFLSAYCGVLVMHVLYLKPKEGYSIAFTDAGMNDFLRVALYQAQHPLVTETEGEPLKIYDVVGPVCESADFFAKKIALPKLQEQDRLYLLHTGAYGEVMASMYNSRLLLPAFLLKEENITLIERPGFYSDLVVREL